MTGSRRLRFGERHVDLGAQRARAVGELAGRACARTGRGSPRTERFAVGAVRARLGQRAAILADLAPALRSHT